jgi:hypothetical protein
MATLLASADLILARDDSHDVGVLEMKHAGDA